MDQFKKGDWNIADLGSPLDLDKCEDLIDDKMAKNVANDIRRELGAAALKPHKPLLAPSANGGLRPSKDPQFSKLIGGDPKKSPAGNGAGKLPVQKLSKVPSGPNLQQQQDWMQRAVAAPKQSKDQELLTQMTKRLAQLEGVNKSLKLEIREMHEKNAGLKAQNESLRALTSADSIQTLDSLKKERDKFK